MIKLSTFYIITFEWRMISSIWRGGPASIQFWLNAEQLSVIDFSPTTFKPPFTYNQNITSINPMPKWRRY